MRPVMTEQLARAAATDAGNRSMRAARRTHWNHDDFITASTEWHRLNRLYQFSVGPMLPEKKQKEVPHA